MESQKRQRILAPNATLGTQLCYCGSQVRRVDKVTEKCPAGFSVCQNIVNTKVNNEYIKSGGCNFFCKNELIEFLPTCYCKNTAAAIISNDKNYFPPYYKCGAKSNKNLTTYCDFYLHMQQDDEYLQQHYRRQKN